MYGPDLLAAPGSSLQVRAFVKNIEGNGKQELNQSPLPFVETAAQPGVGIMRCI
jgi:hypothetical protein